MAINAFLFAWNREKYPWTELSECVEQLAQGHKVRETWSCASHKKVRVGDRAFFSRVGAGQRGLFASGYIISEPFIGKNHRGKENYRVHIEFDVLLDVDKTEILTLELLNIGKMQKQLWTPQASGILIKPEIQQELELLWEDFISLKRISF